MVERKKKKSACETVSYTSQRPLTGGAGTPVWLIGTGTHKTVGLCEAEVSAAAIIHATEVGT